MKPISNNIRIAIIRTTTCLFYIVLAVNCCAQQLASAPTVAAPQQLATTLSSNNNTISANGSTYFIETPNKRTFPTIGLQNNSAGSSISPISASRSRRTVRQTTAGVGAKDGFSAYSSAPAQQGAAVAASAMQGARRAITFRAIDAFNGYVTAEAGSKNPPYNPPEVSKDNFDQITWQKATNGSPVGEATIPLMLMALAFIFLHRKYSTERK